MVDDFRVVMRQTITDPVERRQRLAQVYDLLLALAGEAEEGAAAASGLQARDATTATSAPGDEPERKSEGSTDEWK